MQNFGTICFFILCFSFYSNAQTKTDITLIQTAIDKSAEGVNNTKQRSLLKKTSNPFKIASFLMLSFYQKIISEQISAGCEFDMSCSNFGINSIKEFGLLKGIGLTADRLTRCNGVAQYETENHLINHTSGKVIDEPSMYRFNK
jgi:putative component of membrane protein insertase Oxa1/YidC/SpoIIIJ protein YidD